MANEGSGLKHWHRGCGTESEFALARDHSCSLIQAPGWRACIDSLSPAVRMLLTPVHIVEGDY